MVKFIAASSCLLFLAADAFKFHGRRPRPGPGDDSRPPPPPPTGEPGPPGPPGPGPDGPGGIDPCNASAYVRYDTPSASTQKCNYLEMGVATDPSSFMYKNQVEIYTCPNSGFRIIKSNGIPDHTCTRNNPNEMCETPWLVKIPLNPTYVSATTEPGRLGPIAFQLNGVPIYGANEGDAGNAVEPGDGPVQDAQYWFGHAARAGDWHYHSPLAGHETTPTSDDLIAYSMDGFPIYGPLSDDEVNTLDVCNGRNNPTTGQYQYHVRLTNQVDADLDYCPANSNANNTYWNYIIGCYHGDVSTASVSNAESTSLPSDCVLEN